MREDVGMQSSPQAVPRLTRPTQGRVLAGVCRGIADHVGVDVRVVRILFIIVGMVSGAGIVAYLFLWAMTPVEETLGAGRPIDPAQPVSAQAQNPPSPERTGGTAMPRGSVLLAVGVLTILVGGIALLQGTGTDVRAGILLPVLLVAIGAVVAWAQLDATQRARWTGIAGWRGLGMARLAVGIGVVALGLFAFVTRGQSAAQVWDVALATLSILVGTALICAPFAVRLWSDFRREQDARVRETERADIAAHLHDGVLQTLALIQRGADDPAYVVTLARKQERELRSWLYGSNEDPSQTLAAAVTAAAAEVEDLHSVAIDVVVTGDRPLDEGGTALVRAVREALLNAVRHGSPPVSVYVEIGPDAVEAFVRDHGAGFDVDAVPHDRLGVRESILGRMTRHGGTARIRRREPGTEVILTMPHQEPDPDAAPRARARAGASSGASAPSAASAAAPAASDANGATTMNGAPRIPETAEPTTIQGESIR